jgi:hypothetical protein
MPVIGTLIAMAALNQGTTNRGAPRSCQPSNLLCSILVAHLRLRSGNAWLSADFAYGRGPRDGWASLESGPRLDTALERADRP